MSLYFFSPFGSIIPLLNPYHHHPLPFTPFPQSLFSFSLGEKEEELKDRSEGSHADMYLSSHADMYIISPNKNEMRKRKEKPESDWIEQMLSGYLRCRIWPLFQVSP